MPSTVATWNVFEFEAAGPAGGNPFIDVTFAADFSKGSRSVPVPGFYDGDGVYRVRFMPDDAGSWSFRTHSNRPELDGLTGCFDCTSPDPGVHGPVQVSGRHHFAYADGTPYFPFGTTCYAWTHQPLEMQAETLATLDKARFNKLRMCVFPKDYIYNTNPPLHDVYARGTEGALDFDRPNPMAFRHFEAQVAALMQRGIEADIIIFHPYDRWGYAEMTPEQDFRYVAHLAARLAAYRNVWWSLANEYDFLLNIKPMAQWDRYFHILEENDPYRHLKSIHNGDVRMNFDHRKPWVDHVCIQNADVRRTDQWREDYGKPLVNDELQYEGNIVQAWGCISARELVHRFWTTVMRGGYAGHGETYAHPEDLLWWAKGGALRGESWPRIGFLRDLIEADVTRGLDPLGKPGEWPWTKIAAAGDGRVRFIYFGEHQPVQWAMGLPLEDGDYDLDVIDPWEMTVTPLEKTPPPKTHPTRHGAVVRGLKPDAAFGVNLPGKPYLALRARTRLSGR